MAVALLSMILFISLSQYNGAFHFIASTNEINFYGTPKFSMECSKRDMLPEPSKMTFVVIIRVLKKELHKWRTFAEINHRNYKILRIDRARLNGTVGHVYGSYLRVTWETALQDVAGIYKCVVMGFTPNMHPAVYESELLEIQRQFAPMEPIPENFRRYFENLHSRLVKVRQFVRTNVGDIEVKMDDAIEKVSSLFHSFLKSLRSRVHGELEDITHEQKQVLSQYQQWENAQQDLDITTFEKHQVSWELPTEISYAMDSASQMQWPEGSYGLLSPDSGCPESFGRHRWNIGYRTHHTESDLFNSNKISFSAHMKRPIETDEPQNKKITQHFCTMEHSPGDEWPPGSYCINRKRKHCPSGFSDGSIFWDDLDGENENKADGALPYMVGGSNTELFYCCRDDASPSSPITLPTNKPFYLYRYGAQCQEVVGMFVTPEYISFRTDCCTSKADRAAPGNAVSEGGNRVTLHLCYYQSTTSQVLHI